MDFFHETLMYEINFNGLMETEAIKQIADHTAKEIKSISSWDADVLINVEPEVKDKRLFSVSINVSGIESPVFVKKTGKNPLSVFKKARKTVLRQIHRLIDRKIAVRKRQYFKEQYAS